MSAAKDKGSPASQDDPALGRGGHGSHHPALRSSAGHNAAGPGGVLVVRLTLVNRSPSAPITRFPA